jgi:hypothetical protein
VLLQIDDFLSGETVRDKAAAPQQKLDILRVKDVFL